MRWHTSRYLSLAVSVPEDAFGDALPVGVVSLSIDFHPRNRRSIVHLGFATPMPFCMFSSNCSARGVLSLFPQGIDVRRCVFTAFLSGASPLGWRSLSPFLASNCPEIVLISISAMIVFLAHGIDVPRGTPMLLSPRPDRCPISLSSLV